MRILFAIKSLSVPGGGAERVLADVANGLSSRGHTIGVVTFDKPGADFFYPLSRNIERFAIDLGTPGHPTPRRQLPAALMRLRSTVSGWAPDVAIGFMHSTYVLLAMAMAGSGIRLVASEHAGFSHFEGRSLERFLVSLVWSKFSAATVPSQSILTGLPERMRSITHVLPNPLDLARFACPGTTEDPPEPHVLCVGRFMEQKDHATLIRAFSRVSPHFPSWRLRLAGDGVLRPAVEALVAELGIKPRVEIPGVIEDIASEYRRASIVAVPSRYESFGLCVAEALASRRPVIGFHDCLAHLGICLNGRNSLLVEGSGDRVAALSEGLAILMGDSGLRSSLGNAGPEAVLRFDRDEVLGQWEQFVMDGVTL